uniref:Uncharacterized protein n=2 Tax=Plectus sambesii TaxID=2011161 RepID=A0A914W3I6_9BILA
MGKLMKMGGMKMGGKRFMKAGKGRVGGGRGGIIRKRGGHVGFGTRRKALGSRNAAGGLGGVRFAGGRRRPHQRGARKGGRKEATAAESYSSENSRKNRMNRISSEEEGGRALSEQLDDLSTSNDSMDQPAMMHDDEPQMQRAAQVSRQSYEQQLRESSTTSPPPPPASRQRSRLRSLLAPLGERLLSGAITGRFGARWWPPAPSRAADEETVVEVVNIEDVTTEEVTITTKAAKMGSDQTKRNH